MPSPAKQRASCDVFGADDPRDFSVSFQGFLSYWHRELGNKLKARAAGNKVVRFPAFTWQNWQVLQELTQLIRVRGDIPEKSARKCDPVQQRPSHLRPNPRSIITDIDPETNWPPSDYFEARDIKLGDPNIYHLLNIEDSHHEGGPCLIWSPHQNAWGFAEAVREPTPTDLW